ncbi:MAG: cisplatin damage response ATP-dependent DNA ligase [Pseudomonadota bacterium]
MHDFAVLLERLLLTPSRNRKIELLCLYFGATDDPDRGLALAALNRELDLPGVKPALFRQLASEVCDEELFRLSYDFVGDLAETVSLIWPQGKEDTQGGRKMSLGEIVETLSKTSRSEAPQTLRGMLDIMTPDERYALIKLATGGLRIGVSSRLAKQALAEYGKVDVGEIEEIWHGLAPPYLELFAWLDGKAQKPVSLAAAPFRPVMLSHALEDRDHAEIGPDTHIAEWKWDGIRVQAVCEQGTARLYSRTGDDISGAFPDLVGAMDFEGAIDGELLVGTAGGGEDATASFADLQKRLNRKKVSQKLMDQYPAFIRSYDLLIADGEDLRNQPLAQRRKILEQFVLRLEPSRFDLSEIIEFSNLDELAKFRADPPHPVIEGLMLKRRDSHYVAGRPKGPWFKWKKDPYLIDAVLMYAQRGHGKRSGFYSDYTFGVWTDIEGKDGLVPVGKAYFGFTDEELKRIDRFVRENTVERFGPVRSVRAEPDYGLVLEVAFEGLSRSTRHKSGVAMRFPRISRLRWDKPPAEADRLPSLFALLN